VTSELDVPSSAEAQGHLAHKATRAFSWSFLNTVVSRLGTMFIGIVLARLLGPEAFGTFAVATVAMLAMLSFNELGVSLAIVRWKDDPARIAPTVNSISVLSSVMLFGVVVLTAPSFASAMGNPEATNVVRLMSIAIVIDGTVATPAALLQREFKQGRRMAIDQMNTWLGAVVSLALALTGVGAMSLAIGRIAGSLVSAVMFLLWSPLAYSFGFDTSTAKALLRFGLPLAGASMIVFAVGYADQLVAGAILGSTALGFYVLAFNVSSWPVAVFSRPLRNVAPAAFARLQHDRAQMNDAYQRTLGLLTAVALPVCALLAGASKPIIEIIYGAEWAAAATVLALLGIVAAARIFFELSYDYLVVLERSRSIFIIQILWLATGLPGLIAGARIGGLQGIAIAQTVVAIAIILPAYIFVLVRAGICLRTIVVRLFPAALVGICVWFVARIAADNANPAAACFIGSLGACTAITLQLIGNRSNLGSVRFAAKSASARPSGVCEP
jgi:O-antigen/teichoic acid export membrane protein